MDYVSCSGYGLCDAVAKAADSQPSLMVLLLQQLEPPAG